jgi:hypothetical protein|tara:strand:- start:47 stop:298 length:252 start_codon:yes stop_codon:yes gene_type:complete
MDKKLLQYILKKCETTIEILSKTTPLNYQQLYQVIYSDRRLKDYELEVLSKYLKRKTELTNHYIDKRINKIKDRNNANIKGDR